MTTLPTTTRHDLSDHSKDNGHTPATGALNGLIAPLRQLDRRLQQTIEVTQVLCGTAFQAYLLGSIMPAAAPADVVSAGSALDQLKANFGLSDFDVSVVVMAIAPELDRRYERLYAKLQTTEQSTGARKPTLSLALSVLCNTEAEQLTERERLLTGSPLSRLLQPLNEQALAHPGRADEATNHRRGNRLEGQALQLKTAVSRYLLNQRSLAPLQQLATCCHLSWPQRNRRPRNDISNKNRSNKNRSNKRQPSQPPIEQTQPSHAREAFSTSSVLAAFIARIRQGEAPLPLSLQFCGPCVGRKEKQQAAAHVAMAAQAPLLRVNLTQLIRKANLNAAQSKLAVEQVILQSQLWQAVLYLEDTTELPTPMPAFIHPGLIEQLSCQLAHYPGITIFAGRSPHIPTANNGKGILPIPFTEALPQQQARQKPVVTAAQLALNEIEKFRLMLIQSSVEFG